MRPAVLFVALLALIPAGSLAQNAPPVTVIPVSYGLPGDTLPSLSFRGFPTDGSAEPAFEIGRPEGSGARDAPALQARPRAVSRLAERRSKKAFGMPWQTGIFQ